MITDCHIHIQPIEMFKPHALELIKKKRANFEQIAEYCRSPKAFLGHMDAAGIERAVLINYVAPEVIGFTSGVNQFIAVTSAPDSTRGMRAVVVDMGPPWSVGVPSLGRHRPRVRCDITGSGVTVTVLETRR